MGGRGGSSGGGIGQKFINSLPDYELKYIDSRWNMGNFGTKSSQIEFMRNNGIPDSDIDEMNRLLTLHGGTSAQQGPADAEIVSHLQAGDSIGKALNMQIQMEEAMYKRWMQSHPNGNDRIYRKGDRKTGVESWTTNEDGADMGSGGIGYDHSSSVSALMSQGYHILGGMGRHLGSPGEGEVTMIKY